MSKLGIHYSIGTYLVTVIAVSVVFFIFQSNNWEAEPQNKNMWCWKGVNLSAGFKYTTESLLSNLHLLYITT